LRDFAPRIGFAWRPLPSKLFVVRSAYGISYDAMILNANLLPRFNPPFFAVQLALNSGTNTIQNILNQPAFPQPPISVTLDRHVRDPYFQHWNPDLQYEPVKEMLLDLAYVGTKGTGLPLQRNLNQAQPGTFSFLFPQFGPIILIGSSASSTYHSLQFRAERRFARETSILTAYTYSKSIDDSSAIFGTSGEAGYPQNSNNLRGDRGLSNFDARHRLVLEFLYSSPVHGGSGLGN
jgi:hypothetical protein